MIWRCGILLILFAFLVGLLSSMCATRCNSCPQNGCNQFRVDNGVCSRAYYVTYSYKVSYLERISYGGYSWTWTEYKTRYRMQLKCAADQCCNGWNAISNSPLTCEPICTGGCLNGGLCVEVDACSCPSGWTGANCETAICTGGCLNGGLCVEPDTCSCPSEWTGANCETDIDECSSNTSECNHYCNNTDGWYFCTCQDGFILGTDKHNCTDVDECNSTDNGGCDHNCSNTPGSYNCSCNEGFTMMGENNTCTEVQASRAEEPLLGTSGVAAVSGGAVFVIIAGLVLCVVVALAVKLRGTFCHKKAKDKTQDTEPPPEDYSGFELTPNPAYAEISYVKSDKSQNGGAHSVNDDDGVGNVYVSTHMEPPAYENFEMLY